MDLIEDAHFQQVRIVIRHLHTESRGNLFQ